MISFVVWCSGTDDDDDDDDDERRRTVQASSSREAARMWARDSFLRIRWSRWLQASWRFVWVERRSELRPECFYVRASPSPLGAEVVMVFEATLVPDLDRIAQDQLDRTLHELVVAGVLTGEEAREVRARRR